MASSNPATITSSIATTFMTPTSIATTTTSTNSTSVASAITTFVTSSIATTFMTSTSIATTNTPTNSTSVASAITTSMTSFTSVATTAYSFMTTTTNTSSHSTSITTTSAASCSTFLPTFFLPLSTSSTYNLILILLLMMMMINRQHPTVEIPQPWDPPYDDPISGGVHGVFSPQTNAYFSALHRFLPSSSCESDLLDDSFSDTDSLSPHDSCDDNFRMYEFKVRRCARGRSHDWTECPFAHPGEKARRRDPRKFHYSGAACPDFRRGCCRKGDSCEYAHGVFECWLHPARYRTQPCKDGPHCLRRVCFFAHSPDQLRLLPTAPESPPSGRLGLDSVRKLGISPVSVLDVPESPPMSPSFDDSVVSELVNSVRGMQIGPVSPSYGCGGWGGFGSPRSPTTAGGYFGSVASQVTRTATRSGLGWEAAAAEDGEEEVAMERVESGKGVRERMYAKLRKENSLERDRVDSSASPGPDFGWVSELVM